MASHKERLAAASDAIEFICSRDPDEMSTVVPNCPGWTVYNVAAHIGRVGLAWHSMIDASPDDPDSRARGYADAESRGSGHSPKVLASWVRDAVEALDGDVDHPAYFSMTGGAGTVGLWGWHAASELGIHRLDVEQALGTPYAITDHLALDALDYTCRFFLPAMATVTDTDPGVLRAVAARDGTEFSAMALRATQGTSEPEATITGLPIDVLLALWGRPHGPIDIAGSHETLDRWCALPSTAFQFGTWD
jgi:uncharacterized protein (TIGR03083 family)